MDPITLALSLAAQFAPSLLRYFGAGEKPTAIAAKVIDIARSVTGAPDADAAIAALQADPARAQEFRLAVLRADGDLEALYLADRKDARARDVALAQAGYHNRRGDWMVALDAIGLIACLVAIVGFRGALSGEAVTLITTLASYFGLGLRDAHQFEFGSSRGSRDKDALIGAKP